MKITASFSRKIGLPGYSSYGAECSVETSTAATNPETVAEAIRAAQALAVAAVDQLLAEQAPRTPEPPDPPPAPEPPPPVERNGYRRPDVPRTPYRGGETGHGPAADSDSPRNGRQLLACLLRWSDAAGRDLKPEVVDYGKEMGWGWKVTEWDRDQVAEVTLWLAQARADEKAAAGRTNGRAYAGRAGR